MKRVLLLSLLIPGFALATALPPGPLESASAKPVPTVQLEASAKTQVANDEMVVTLGVDQVGPVVGPLNDAVLTALNTAIAQAKSTSGVVPRMGSVSTSPNWDNGKRSGWHVQGEVILTSKDMKALASLAGKLSESMQLRSMTFQLSEQRRFEEEQKLLGLAAANFKGKAAFAARAFGYNTYVLKDVSVNQAGMAPPPPRPMMMMAKGRAESASLPTEGGDSEVAVTVSGSVVLMK